MMYVLLAIGFFSVAGIVDLLDTGALQSNARFAGTVEEMTKTVGSCSSVSFARTIGLLGNVYWGPCGARDSCIRETIFTILCLCRGRTKAS